MDMARVFSVLGRLVVTIVAAAALASCGGSDGGGHQPPPTISAPSGLGYSSPQSYTVGQAITALTPTVTGTVTSYAVTPALPAGLSLNTTTGTISGTPTTATATADYTVSASNSSGSTTTTVSITVAAAAPAGMAPDISYPGGANFTYTVGDPGEPVVALNTGGAATSWSITPALPNGLVFNTTNGSITGNPTAASAGAQYQVTAQNASGTSTRTIVVQVQTGLLLEMGHDSRVNLLRITATRAASQDSNGHWVLWDYATGNIISHGHSSVCGEIDPCFQLLPIDLAGSLFVIGRPTGFEVYSAADGTVLWQFIAAGSWWKLAPDGSYIAAGNASGLYVYAASGRQLLKKSGDYHQANVVTTASEIRVAEGPAGANVIETLALPSGTSTVSPTFQGTFSNWFADGESFLSSLGNTVWIYSKAAIQQDIFTGSSLDKGGEGSWYWRVLGTNLNIYAVGNSTTPVLTVDLGYHGKVVPAGAQLGIIAEDTASVTIINLSGATPVKTDYALPFNGVGSFAALSTAQWAVGMQQGVIVDGASLSSTARYFGNGWVQAVAGSANRFVLAMATGKLMQFDSATSTPQAQLDVPANLLSLSADGAKLAAIVRTAGVPAVKTLALPSGTVLATSVHTDVTANVVLSASGTTLGEVGRSLAGQTYLRYVFPATGGADIFSDVLSGSGLSNGPALWLSPDGSLIAAPTGDPISSTTTQIYNAGGLATAVSGWAAGWLDNSRLLVNEYNPATMLGAPTFAGVSIYSPTGVLLGTSPLTELRAFQVLDADHIYSPETNTILSVSTGATTWRSINPYSGRAPNLEGAGGGAVNFPGPPGLGAVAGAKVVFVSDTVVRAEPY